MNQPINLVYVPTNYEGYKVVSIGDNYQRGDLVFIEERIKSKNIFHVFAELDGSALIKLKGSIGKVSGLVLRKR